MIQERICANRLKTTIREHQHSLRIQPPLIAPGWFGVSFGRKRNAKPAESDERRLYSKANINNAPVNVKPQGGGGGGADIPRGF